MTTTDYLLNFALIGLVILQLRGRRLSTKMLILPLGVVGYVASQYLHSFPTAGNDVVFELSFAALGALLGIGCALTSRLWRDGSGFLVVKAGVAAAGLWVVGVGSRLAFEIFATHGGADTIGRFSLAHHITPEAWVTGLVLMAISEVVFRSTGIWYRAWRLGGTGQPVLGAGQAGGLDAGSPLAAESSVR